MWVLKSKCNTRSSFQVKWDRKKKKFVRTDNGDPKKKKVKTESGNWISASYNTNMYVMSYIYIYILHVFVYLYAVY